MLFYLYQPKGAFTMNTAIYDIDYYLPSQVVKTADLLAETQPDRVGFTTDLISDLLGIQEVRYAESPEMPSTLAIKAAEKLFSRSSIRPDQIGLIIFCGIDRDYCEPSTAHFVQAAIGSRAICFDISNACLGFMSGIQVANAMIADGTVEYALICTGERPSEVAKSVTKSLKSELKRTVFWNKVGGLTVGDAGAAAIIGPKTGKAGLVGMKVTSAGKLARLCYYRWNDRHEIDGRMHMKEISNAILDAHRDLYPQALAAMNLDPERINCLITHQVGKRPWERYPEIMGVDQLKMTKTFDLLGNITSATFAVNYAQALESKRIKKGDLVFAAMAGSGLSVCQMGMIV
jgi:3-oxoacyl-[acyl-carrier-protein] synthase III